MEFKIIYLTLSTALHLVSNSNGSLLFCTSSESTSQIIILCFYFTDLNVFRDHIFYIMCHASSFFFNVKFSYLGVLSNDEQ